eukprot:TRINITY_DN8455_c0_g1_i7.p1 TRINITY_DN8455_c0_g1~~TRINITY_DN8455_c0_g1_i7.p1  ORF type:complete len:422 (+),score=81.93 TRINITY_DN8455_c0_g1_i7:111-1376(+)
MISGEKSIGCCCIAMKQKAFYLLVTCIIFSTIFMILLPVQKPRTLHNIVKETQKKILSLHSNLVAAGDELESVAKAKLNPDTQYMQLLGLPPYQLHVDPPGASDELLIVTAVPSGSLAHVPGFLQAISSHLQLEYSVLIHDLGLSRRDKESLRELCNSTQCQVSQFVFQNWPNHVKDLKLRAYRPILIQLGLRESTSVLWMDIDTRIVNSNIKPLLEKVRSSYILTWPEQPVLKDGMSSGGATPTTALTHPRMFEYFPQTKKEDYEFQHMITGKCILLNLGDTPKSEEENQTENNNKNSSNSNSQEKTGGAPYPVPPVITSLMVPWLKCILIEDCINPIGAQSTGCRFDKKPMYRYSGCHRYDVSALNIVLGEMFSFHESYYTSNMTVFKRITLNKETTRGGSSSSSTTSPLNVSDYGLIN